MGPTPAESIAGPVAATGENDRYRACALLTGGQPHKGGNARASVLVVVSAVSRMPASVVHVVDMIPVWDRDMATALTMDVAMVLVHRVAGRFTFVVVILVPSMKVASVRVVDVISVWDRDVAASFAVRMIMVEVLIVGCAGHRLSPPYRICSQLLHGNLSPGRVTITRNRAVAHLIP